MSIDPIFVRVKEAAVALGVSPWRVYKLLDEQKIASQYEGASRLVRVDSLRAYADSLPTTKPEGDVA